eukprot:EG_transcript_5859
MSPNSPSDDVAFNASTQEGHALLNGSAGSNFSTFCDVLLSPFYRFISWVRLLCSTFGTKFVLFIVIGEHLFRGFLEGNGSNGGGFLVLENLVYVHLKVGASTKSILMAVSGSSWSLKPIYGMISDTFVVGGSRRAPWIVATAVLGTLAVASIYGFGPRLGPAGICLCFFAIRMQIAWTDLMIEAAYTEKMQAHPEHGSDIVSWVWTGIAVATIFGVLFVGPGLDYFDPFTIMGAGIPVVGIIIIPAYMNWLGDHAKQKPAFGFDWAILRQQRNLFLCSIGLSVAVVVASACAILQLSLARQAAVATCGAVLVAAAGVLYLPPGLWKPMLFMFISEALSIQANGFYDNFYLDAATPEEAAQTGFPVCVDCPHFSTTFYVTVLGIWDSVFMVFGLWLFNDWMPNWTYRKALFLTQVATTLSLLLDIIQLERWNTRWGVPDTVFMVLKHAVQNTVATAHFMPSTVLISKLCPEGVESTVFSLLAGFSNFGMTIAAFLGAYALELIGLGDIGSGEVDEFRYTWVAVVLNACTPLLSLLFLPWLIPDARLTDLLALRTSPHHEVPLADDAEWPQSFASDLSGPASEPWSTAATAGDGG